MMWVGDYAVAPGRRLRRCPDMCANTCAISYPPLKEQVSNFSGGGSNCQKRASVQNRSDKLIMVSTSQRAPPSGTAAAPRVGCTQLRNVPPVDETTLPRCLVRIRPTDKHQALLLEATMTHVCLVLPDWLVKSSCTHILPKFLKVRGIATRST